MKQANISTTKNNLSRILAEVRAGETYIIVDRNVPIAKIESLVRSLDSLDALVSDGVVSPPKALFDAPAFLERAKTKPRNGISIVDALLADRDPES
jgi:prevent-host-death family protein